LDLRAQDILVIQQYHTVQPNETWSSVAQRYGVSVRHLQVVNPRAIRADLALLPGEELAIPSRRPVTEAAQLPTATPTAISLPTLTATQPAAEPPTATPTVTPQPTQTATRPSTESSTAIEPPTAQPAAADIVINEIDADMTGVDRQEFVELYDGGAGNTRLDGLAVVFFNGKTDRAYAAYYLDGQMTDADGFFVLGSAELTPPPDLAFGPNRLQNGADAVALYRAEPREFRNGTPITVEGLLDIVVYGTDDADDEELLNLLDAGPQLNENARNNKNGDSLGRCPDGGAPRDTRAFTVTTPTPGEPNDCPDGAPNDGETAFGACGDPATLIPAVQGDGDISPLQGQRNVVIEGIVNGDFQAESQLRGFFVQEEPEQTDGDAATSDGLFVFDDGFGVDVAPGDQVRVRGQVIEFRGLTEMMGVTDLVVCANRTPPTPMDVTLPVADVSDWERYEGMLITMPQTLTVSGNYTLGRYGELILAADERLWVPTNRVEPGAPALALQAANDRNRILLDDGATGENPNPAPYLAERETLRAGDLVAGVTGVLSYGFDAYRIQPTAPIQVTIANPRPEAPPPVGGTLRVASFNVLNYFDGDGSGGGFPTPRGADTPAEFADQRAKIISALVDLDADIIGLIEVENDAAPNSALADLVAGLNAEMGAETYALIDTGVIGSDAIRVALVYRPDTVEPVGDFAVLDSSVDPAFVDDKNRPALAQTFAEKASGERLTVAVNHLKSKGSDCADVGDPDAGDGQGNCNLTRTRAAMALVNWLATDPTASGDPDVLIIGDLNAYAREDPITAIRDAGYTDLIQAFQGGRGYSYVFDGQAGYLDHALASPSLTPQVTGTAVWHINADEPRALDYNDFNQPGLYRPDPFRSSDHDPVLVGLAPGS
jgi:hypothetical protein